jgi:hypothetical protein
MKKDEFWAYYLRLYKKKNLHLIVKLIKQKAYTLFSPAGFKDQVIWRFKRLVTGYYSIAPTL